MSEVLAGMTVGQMLDRVFRLMRACWRLFIGIAILPAIAISTVMAAAMTWWMAEIEPSILAHPGTLPHIPIYPLILIFAGSQLVIPLYALYAPAAIHAATRANLGVRVGFRQSYSVAWRHYGRYLWLMVLMLLYINVPLAVAGALIGAGAFLILHGSPPGTLPVGIFMLIPAGVLAYFGFMVYAVLIMLRFAVAYPAAVAEDLAARAALRRSTALTCGARGRIFLVLLVVAAASMGINMAIMTVLEFVAAMGAVAAMLAHVAVGSAAFYALAGLAVLAYVLFMVVYCAFTYAVINTALAVVYHDQRWRKDGIAPWALPA